MQVMRTTTHRKSIWHLAKHLVFTQLQNVEEVAKNKDNIGLLEIPHFVKVLFFKPRLLCVIYCALLAPQ